MPDADALEILLTSVEPLAPADRFTITLRARLLRELSLPEGETAMTLTDTPAQTRVPRSGALPYLAVHGGRAAIDFYRAAFGAEVIGDPYVMGDGRIGHAELAMGGGTIYLADEFPDIGVVAPSPGGSPVSLMIAVEDTDAAVERLRSAGGIVTREAEENYGSRGATVVDPFGHRWMLSGPVITPPRPDEDVRDGDLGYISWWTPDADRAARFYGTVLGWAYDTGNGPRRHVRGSSLSTGIDGGHADSTLFCCYALADVDAAVERVAAAGGSAEAPTEQPFGRSAMCVDPSGTQFAIYQPPPDANRPAINGERAGDLTYVTYAAVDSTMFKEFYGAVLGWTFSGGRVHDGWEPVDVAPMSGMAGGSTTPATIPMWKVDDVAAAAERVRAAGGRILEAPSRQPYGMSAFCEDDQGGRFYLGDA